MESIAQVAREVRDWELAEHTAKQMLDHDAAYAGSHYAMALVAEQKGERQVAEQEFARAEALWRDADAELPELSYARKMMTSRRSRLN